MLTSETKKPEQKRVTITSKRQFTIPRKFYSELGFGREAVCIMGEGMLIIKPAVNISGGEFAEQILAELIQEGFTGTELLKEFKERQNKIQPAVKAMLNEAKKVAEGAGEYSTYADIFGTEEE